TLIQKLQVKGLVAPGTDVRAVGEMLFNNLNMMFIEFAKHEAMPLDELKARVSRQNRPLATLIAAP
ncbi:MAG: TetR/AcrR family transcriptional regulator, partial [Ensifer adhaerens]